MNFLFPSMLAGLGALAVPIILHLIARHRFPVKDFPSIQLLRREKRSNVFAPKLVDKKQLLLRLLVLALLALAMARVFVPLGGGGRSSATGGVASQAPRNLVVVLDCSASMRARRPAAETSSEGLDSDAKSLLASARRRAKELLSGVEPPGHTAVVAAGRRTRVLSPLLPGHDVAVEALSDAETTDGQGEGLVAAMARAAGMLSGRHEVRSRIVVLTDMRRSAFTRRDQRDLERLREVRREMGERLEVVLLEMSARPTGQDHNLSVVEARIRESGGARPVRGVQVGDDAHVVARVRYSAPAGAGSDAGGAEEEGSEDEAPEPITARMRLLVGKQKEPVGREIQFEPTNGDSDVVVDLTTRMNKPVQVFARPFIERKGSDADALVHDDARSVPLKVANLLRCLIIDGTVQAEKDADVTGLPGGPGTTGEETEEAPQQSVSGVKVLRYVLNPVRELGQGQGTGINTTVVTPEGLAGQTLSKYSVIFLYDVSSLGERALRDLDAFVEQGGALLFICSDDLSPMKFNRALAAAGKDRKALAPARMGNEVNCDPPVGIGLPVSRQEGQKGLLAPFQDRRRGDLSVVRLSSVRSIRSMTREARVLFRSKSADDQKALPLALEMERGRGRIMLLTFGFELDSTNIARTRVFPALMWRIVAHLTGELEQSANTRDVLTALEPAVLDASDQRFAFVDELELAPVATEVSEPLEGLNPALVNGKGERKAQLLPIREDRTVLVEGLPAGDYRLQKVQEEGGAGPVIRRGRLIAVNPDPTESNMARVSEDALSELRRLGGEGVGPFRVVHSGQSLSPAARGMELWQIVVLLLAVGYAAEGVVGWWLSAQREKERSAGAEA